MAAIIKSAPVSAKTFALGSARDGVATATQTNKPEQRSVETASRPSLGESKSVAATTPNRNASAPPAQSDAIPTRDIDAEVARKVQQGISEGLAEREAALADEASLARQQAIDEGYQEGVRRAEADTAQQRQSLHEHIERLQEALEHQVAQAFASIEALAAEVSLLALRKILGDGIASGDTVRSVVRAQLDRAGESGAVLIRLNAEDLALLEGCSDTVDGRKEHSRLSFQADLSVSRGGCIVETERGIFDARLETQLEAFVAALRAKSQSHPEAQA